MSSLRSTGSTQTSPGSPFRTKTCQLCLKSSERKRVKQVALEIIFLKSCLLWPEAVSDDDEVGGGVGGAVQQGREHVVQVEDIPAK